MGKKRINPYQQLRWDNMIENRKTQIEESASVMDELFGESAAAQAAEPLEAAAAPEPEAPQAAPEQPAVPMVQGEPLRAALAAIRFGRASA